ncbi:isoleucine--tRNA ligase [Lysinibacillus sp. HST-98]|uniref:isoleucine--tRNA ligase n=1 Tax=Lysinibacillus TaxID=400634 RepID=UPI0001DA5633|nr:MULTISPECIES: isoleucine--tRNA ligase [Lysinibacillus]EFI69191.1 isoleucyl-tRNA synthetase 1 [Lysinibacillus fusiformis ZC1]EKU41705.1 isoleucyl-tRNA synthetase 1 [Lysinibacillus fusiformis ZB2]MBL3731068.1 isoleucine--tRNA ligase [Lysinibacillus sp. HST-98]MBU5251673.1 isoleucine--tRNA ligase [Lysinibacillus capsici]MED4701542.1 isoleucine--tRNA ligase [Lysinibacillus capsici]
MVEYKDTLLMPKTDFPMRGNLPANEPKMQEKWNGMDINKLQMERTEGRPEFVLHDGPPYANGDIHIGHALNKVLKDMITRHRSMTGYHVNYIPGWDTHGLPIEQALTNKGVKRKEMSVAAFRQLCEEYAYEQIDNQRTQFRRLGIRGDWENPYITLKPEFEARQIEVFGKMAEKGYIYKGLKPVYWSPSSESALAEAEIEYKDIKSPSIYVSFAIKDAKGVVPADAKFIIWTTTPWTLPANLGISLNPEFIYVVVAVANKKFIIAKELLESVATTLGWVDYEVVQEVKGEALDRIVAQHPFYDRESLIMVGEHVTAEAGTGCVHTAPGHGEDDYHIGKQYGLGILSPLDNSGCYTDEAPGFEGVFYNDANKLVTEKLKEVGALEKLDFFTHSYPHDWRTKKPVIYRATPQWFASVEAFRGELLEAVKATAFTPAWGETRLYNMIRDRGDWVISRQRAWGVPIPIFYAENGEPIITPETISHVSALFRENGSNIWFQKTAKELLPEGFTHPGSPNGEFTKENDIMDVWFDSGSSHQGVLVERGMKYPADLYLEGSDQHRGWFNSSLITSVAINGYAPYKGLLTHGFVLDGEGRKMSKSLGNVIIPQKVMDQYGADILRLWVASVDYTADVRISMDMLKQVSEVYRKIRNTFRFLHGNIADFDPKKDRVSYAELREMDQYVYMRLQDVLKTVRAAYDRYDFAAVYHVVNNFVAVELSSFYLDIAKDVVYIEGHDNKDRRAMQTVIYDTLMTLVKIMTPIIPHTTDEMWSYLHAQGIVEEVSVQLTDFPEVDVQANFDSLRTKWEKIIDVRDDILKALEEARNAKTIGKSLEAKVTVYAKEDVVALLNDANIDFAQLSIVSAFEVAAIEEAPAEALTLEHVSIVVEKATGEKCERCWSISETVGSNQAQPTVCARCAEVVEKYYV